MIPAELIFRLPKDGDSGFLIFSLPGLPFLAAFKSKRLFQFRDVSRSGAASLNPRSQYARAEESNME